MGATVDISVRNPVYSSLNGGVVDMSTGVNFITNTARTIAFIAATGIVDPTIIAAVNAFDEYLIANSLDTKFNAMYLVVGGTASAHKYNFFNPVDSDAAFRLSFNGGWTHSSTGMTPNGTTGYANTFLNPSVSLSLNDAALCIYNGTNTATNCIDMGTEIAANVTELYARYANSFYSFINQVLANVVVANTDSKGFYTSSRTASNAIKGYKNGVLQATASTTTASSVQPNNDIYIGASKIGAPAALFADRRIQFASIGSGLDATQAANLYTAVQTLQTSLGRQV